MTGRYPFRYGMTTYTISADAPWGIPLEEPFFPVELQELGYRTFMSGKWHLGAFRPQHLPQFRGFDEASGLQNAQADHWTHVIDGAFDWHALSAEGFWETRFEANGTYAGRLVLDATLASASHLAVYDSGFYVWRVERLGETGVWAERYDRECSGEPT